jgi:1,2-diacylglycerol 3-beta-glucosyltransferase
VSARATRGTPARATLAASFGLQGCLALASGYLLSLLAAAATSRPRNTGGAAREAREALRLVVLVPAHNEEAGIDATLRSLRDCAYPRAKSRVVVIADNCDDRTAERACDLGAEAWERTAPEKHGKGHALAWALGRLAREGASYDAVVMLDADCIASPNMLSEIDERLRSGASAVQVNYLAGNPEASSASALRFAGLALMNTVRFQGKQRLGLSCGLVGSGMAFTRAQLNREPWRVTGLVEDSEYHMRLVLSGARAEFVSEAWIRSAMPTSLQNSSEERWEQGRLQLIRRWVPRLLSSGITTRDVVALHSGLECLVPPQSLIAAGSIVSAGAGVLLGSRPLRALSAFTLLAQGVFVLGGLRLVRAPRSVYRALLIAPALIVVKVALYARLLSGRGPTSWVRTERAPAGDLDVRR